MRRFHALLLAAGLGAAPASVVAEPSHSSTPPTATHVETWPSAKGRLGVLVSSITPELRQHLGAPSDRGVLVERVTHGSPAETAGIAVGDVIVAVNSRAIDAPATVIEAVAGVKAHGAVDVQLIRDRRSMLLRATLQDDSQDTSSAVLEWFRG